MKATTRFSLALALAALCPAAARAQTFAVSDVSVPAAPASYYYSDANIAAGPACAAPACAAAAPTCAAAPACGMDPTCGMAACDGGCGDSCDCCCSPMLDWLSRWPCGCSLECLGEKCSLVDRFCCFKERGGVMGGWLAAGYVWNPYQPNERFNGPMTWNDRANEAQFNEFYFYAGRAANTEGCGWDVGWRIDTLYGSSYRWNTSGGFETNFGNNQFYGLAVPAMYGEVAYNNLTVKVGRFVSPVGYYTIGTANNYFPILPYTYQYGEPFTQTGILATQKVSDSFSFGYGITHGWDNTDNTGNPHAGGLLTGTWTIDECRSFAYVGVFGPEPNFSQVNLANNGFGYTNRYFQTLVYTRKFSDDVMGVLQSDFGRQEDAVTAGSVASWYGINSYLYWNMTCRLQWGVNGEWFRDDGGFRVGQVLPSFGSPNARGYARGGFDGSFYRFMFGPKYFFTPNVYGRAAFVADFYDGDANANGDQPFDDGTKDNQQVVAFDLIATF